MKIKKIIIPLVFLISCLGFSANAVSKDIIDIKWQDLTPKDYAFVNPLDKFSDEEYYAILNDRVQLEFWMEKIQEMLDYSPVVNELNEKMVRIAGYAVPLDYDQERATEFLLVPYFGACIHLPPPASNQIIYVKSEKGVKIGDLWDPVVIEGELKTIHSTSEIAEAGYTMESLSVESFKGIVDAPEVIH